MFEEDEGKLREKLLCVYGIGKETADSILLYAGGKLFFVIDAYTRRILGRHGVMQERASYEEYQKLFKTHLPKEVRIYNQYHALLVETGKRYCRREPLCANCPLKDI
jgi:endonuclease-3 related protein